MTQDFPGWISFADRAPPELPATDDPSVLVSLKVLVTNNIGAKNRVGRPANVWYAHPIEDTINKEWVSFDDRDRKIHGLTHWFDPFAAPVQEDPSEKQQTLMALADRIDRDDLWRTAGLARLRMAQEDRDRLDAGIALRRYAHLWAAGRWTIFPPVGPVHYSAESLAKAFEMARKDEVRRRG